MATLSPADYFKKNSGSNTTSSQPREYKVGFFDKPKIGETRTVRFNYDSYEEIHMQTVHKVKKNPDDRYAQMSIACLGYQECPFCEQTDENGKHARPVTKAYLELINYVRQPDGTMKAQAEAWEAPASVVDTLQAIYEEWGSLRDIVCKVTCSKGSNGFTEYGVQAGNQSAYPESIFVKDFSNFDDYDVTKHLYYVKSAEDIRVYLETGKFPPYVKPETASTETVDTDAYKAPAATTAPVQTRTPYSEDFGSAPAQRPTRWGGYGDIQ